MGDVLTVAYPQLDGFLTADHITHVRQYVFNRS